MDPNKPGTQTSEYQQTVITGFLSLVVSLVAVIHPGFHVSTATQEWIVTTSLTVLGLVTSVYTFARAHLKAAKVKADAQVQAAAAQPVLSESLVSATGATLVTPVQPANPYGSYTQAEGVPHPGGQIS